MKKHTSKEAYYERLKNLAEVNKPSIKESKTRNLGSLIDYKRAADGVAYGIVKENHNYYLKKAGTKTDLNVSDFTYIGGLENITGFQFKSLAEADKQRNMVFHNINEAIGLKPNKTGSRMILREDAAGEEIDQAEEKLGALDAAQSAEEMDSNGEEEMAAGLESEPIGDAPEGEEEISTDSTEEIAPEDGEMPVDGDGGEDATEDGEESLSDMQSKVGKLASEIKSSDLGKEELTWLLKTFIRGFTPNKDEKDNPEANKMLKIDDEDRHEVSDMILDVVSDEEKADLGDNVEKSEIQASMGEGECSECGGFGKYAESRGYGSPETFMECDSEEQANVISGYANAHNDGMNDGDLKTVAIILTPEIIKKLKSDYGHDEYAEKVAPHTDSMNETSDEDKMAELNELWGGLSHMANKTGQAISGAIQKGKEAVGQAAQNVKQTYYAGEKNAAVSRLEGLAQQLNSEIKKVQTTGQKAGQEPINVQSLLQTITSGIQSKGAANLGKFRTAENVDPSNVQVQPNMLKEDGDEIEGNEEKEIGFAPGSQSLGVATVKPEGAPTTGVDITIDPNKNVNISMNESERKLRKYIRTRLEEKAGMKKPSLNENKKSETLKKLDAVIDRQFKLYETVGKKK